MIPAYSESSETQFSPPAVHPAQPAHDKRPNPQSVGSGVCDVLRHHNVGLTGFEPATP